MISLVSGSVEPHLHLDPSLNAKARCNSCMPAGKIFCCMFSCCNSDNSKLRNRAVYCDGSGCCKEFDWEISDPPGRIRKTSARIAHLVSESKPLEQVLEETGVDLHKKAVEGLPITVKELKKVQKAL